MHIRISCCVILNFRQVLCCIRRFKQIWNAGFEPFESATEQTFGKSAVLDTLRRIVPDFTLPGGSPEDPRPDRMNQDRRGEFRAVWRKS